MTRGRFITLEGIDGAGKSTHLAAVRAFLAARGIEPIITREPGGTPLGEILRRILLTESMHGDTELLLMFAARCEHLHRVILPALERGCWVVSDRFTDATYAYQGGGRGVPSGRIALLEDWVQQGLQPDLTLYYDVPPDVAAARMAAGREDRDRFEREAAEFHARVRAAYIARAAVCAERFRTLDARVGVEEVKMATEQALGTLFS